MPKLAGRGVYLAALAVPIAMVAAPLTASAVDTYEAPATETVTAKGDASWFQGSVWNWYWIHDNHQSTGGNINGIYSNSPITNTNINTTEVNGNDGVDVDTRTEPEAIPLEEAPVAEVPMEESPAPEAAPAPEGDVVEEAPLEEPMPAPAPEPVDIEPAIGPASGSFALHHEEWAYAGYDGAESGSIDSASGTGEFPIGPDLDASGSFALYHSEIATAGPDAAYTESVDSASGTGTIGGGAPGSLSGSGAYHHEEFAYAGYDGAAAGSTTSLSGTGSVV